MMTKPNEACDEYCMVNYNPVESNLINREMKKNYELLAVRDYRYCGASKDLQRTTVILLRLRRVHTPANDGSGRTAIMFSPVINSESVKASTNGVSPVQESILRLITGILIL